MTVHFENFTHSFKLNGKPVFAPSDLGRRIGEDIKGKVQDTYEFEHFFYHLGPGGHVAAIHAHRDNKYSCKADIENFFYSISRNRVVSALREIGVARPEHYGKWSSVPNPFGSPRYALPYGFVQSPILSSLVLSRSSVGNFLRAISESVAVAVYVDDITLSSNDCEKLEGFYRGLLDAMAEASLPAKAAKCFPPSEQTSVFNCSLQKNETLVLQARRDKFYALPRSDPSIDGFERYCDRVAKGNSGGSIDG